ncbi:error-prone DNA polymerase [Ferrovibrio sp.]|uniref:error-prone DNA polymerase n=1 Tax=Ferrovibrio sp. TaxID=1917215 RepID=UPI0035B16CE3
MTGYAELHCFSNFSFLEGASHAEELIQQAALRGLSAIAITDRNSLSGIVRAYSAAKNANIQFIVGARLDFQDGPSLVWLPTNRAAYGRLSTLLTIGRRRAPKGACELHWADILDHIDGQQVIALVPKAPDSAFLDRLRELRQSIGDNLSAGISNLIRGRDRQRLARWATALKDVGVPMVAVNDVLYHHPSRRPLHDVLTATRHRCTVQDLGYRAESNAERHIKSPRQMARLFRDHPDAIARTIEIASRCTFRLDELRYEYPEESRGDSATPQEELIRLAWEGARKRYPDGIPEQISRQILHELRLIDNLNYASYFLTVYDIVRYAREIGILCQGRGSAANSVVCYCLGVTSVNPVEQDLLFERFISAERNEPPDIDVDFEHVRREEVMQYIYRKYGRDRAGIAATVISYRPKSAIRDVGRALGLSMDAVNRLARSIYWWSRDTFDADRIREMGIDPNSRLIRLIVQLATELQGFPRHLSQHVGGFVISRGPLHELVPIENASMQDRTCIQWDKDDLDALGLLKVDVLSLGMLTCIRKCFDLLEQHYGKRHDLASIPQGDEETYEMLCRADSVGVFQVESRAQMTMLPRLKPRTFYDLVIEVAIVRPGPIQGDMVHPYLRRRTGEEKVTYPSPALEKVLGKTLGVALFQEQCMRVAIECAGFTPGEADQLRRAMATFKNPGTIHKLKEKLISGMTANGYKPEFAENIYKQLEGFGSYGFPESHAAAFAHLVYISAWLKRHYPAVFCAAILNSQPMGFYAPAQLVRDAKEHGVVVLPIDINYSDWDCTLERPANGSSLAVRLGFRQIRGANEELLRAAVLLRDRPFASIKELWRRTKLPKATLELLGRADAFGSLGLDRRAALWEIRGLRDTSLPLFEFAEDQAAAGNSASIEEDGEDPQLPRLTTGENIVHDYKSYNLTLRPHPLSLLRPKLGELGVVQSKDLATLPENRKVRVGGLVLVRQRPGTASGVIFATIEDETGVANIIIWPKVFDTFRKDVLGSRLMVVEGKLQREGLVIHVVADRIIDRTDLLRGLGEIDIDGAFDGVQSRADEMRQSHGKQIMPVKEVEATFPDGRNFR